MNTIQTCKHAIAMLEDDQCMTGWSDAHTAALRLAVQFLVNSAALPDDDRELAAENRRLHALLDARAKDHAALFLSARHNAADAARYLWLRQADSDQLERVHDDAYRNLLGGDDLDRAIDVQLARLDKETQG